MTQTRRGRKKPRARDLGIPFDGTPGPFNAITDVAGVEVGHTTLISGSGRLVRGEGPVRTGVTAILPRGKSSIDAVPAGWFSLNGNGELTGTTWIEEGGVMEGPLAITNTHSAGVVRDAIVAWTVDRFPNASAFSLPVVGETFDGYLNDVNGFHVKPEHVFAALDSASSGPVAEGGVGGGTGMICHWFKGGIGTSSRRLDQEEGGYTVGVLVQANYGRRADLRIAGAPVGQEILDLKPKVGRAPKRDGSIIIVVATDAPLLPHQTKRLARRAALGLARVGGIAHNSSGDIFLAFSTATPEIDEAGLERWIAVPNGSIDPLFRATVEATEEAIVNALVAGRTTRGIDGNTVHGLPHERVREILRKYGRLIEE